MMDCTIGELLGLHHVGTRHAAKPAQALLFDLA
jgi:hypothetical protein